MTLLDLGMLVRRDAGSEGKNPLDGLGEDPGLVVAGATRPIE